jgi:hypothetical protein
MALWSRLDDDGSRDDVVQRASMLVNWHLDEGDDAEEVLGK